jgi:Ca2+-binding EF-hand superfamily protein
VLKGCGCCLQEAFSELDKDGDGHLTPAELHSALRNTGALAKAGLAADIDPHVLEVPLHMHC